MESACVMCYADISGCLFTSTAQSNGPLFDAVFISKSFSLISITGHISPFSTAGSLILGSAPIALLSYSITLFFKIQYLSYTIKIKSPVVFQ